MTRKDFLFIACSTLVLLSLVLLFMPGCASGGSADRSFWPGGGAWQANLRVDDAPAGIRATYPCIAADPSGNAYTVWFDYRNGTGRVYFSRY